MKEGMVWRQKVGALLAARELLGCVLGKLKETGEELTEPTPVGDIKLKKNERALLIRPKIT